MMSSGRKNHKQNNGVEPSVVKEPAEGVDRRGEAEGEKKALLPSGRKGGMARKRKKGARRKVHWSDRSGNKLVEVKEFIPSDSSDSEDEYLDTCICKIM